MSTELGNLEDLLRHICKEFGITEKEFMSDWRLGVRSLWDKSPIKRGLHNKTFVLVDNTNPRSSKRFPKVKRWECEICHGIFEKGQTEIDHKLGENPCTKFEHAADFINSIALPRSRDDLQVLCKECHAVKTYAERYKVSLEEARVKKQFITLKKSEKDVLNKLKQFGVAEAPKTKAARERLLLELLMKDLEK